MNWVHRIPKIELHVHLEGAIPIPALWTLMEKYGGDANIKSIEELYAKFVYTDFPHFIDTWVWKNQFLREYEDFTYIAEEVAKDFVRQNIIYAEMFHSPSDFYKYGLEVQPLIEAIREGFNKIPGTKINLVIDLIRDFGPKIGMTTLIKINEMKNMDVIGITIGGSEQSFPPEPYGAVYEKAREYGFYTSAHAGEAAGPESVWGAIKTLHVDRIGHGTSAVHDKDLMDYISEHKIPIEVCPISNVKTGAVASIVEHPVRDYFEQGIPISINTDDPKMFGNSLAEEYKILVDQFGFTEKEIIEVLLSTITSSWATDEMKKDLTKRINQFII